MINTANGKRQNKTPKKSFNSKERFGLNNKTSKQ